MENGFGNFIRYLRKQHHLSQNALCKKAHISRSAIASIESGQRWPKRETLAAIGMGLEISPKEFLLSLADYIKSIPERELDFYMWEDLLPLEDSTEDDYYDDD